MKKILVFTDIHFNAQIHDPKHLPNRVERFEAGIAHAQKYHPDAGLVVLTGDLTDEGDPASYELFRLSLEKLHLPFVLMVGNHDRRENFLGAFPQTAVDENGFVQQAIDTPFARLLMLDTLNGPPYEYPHSHVGVLCEKRMQWLDSELAKSAGKQVIIFMHHPPHKTGFTGMDYIRLANEEDFYGMLEKHGNVTQIIAGHVHRTISGNHRGIAFTVFKAPMLQMPMLLDYANADLEVDEPGAYGILLLDEKGVVVHSEDFGLTDYDALIS